MPVRGISIRPEWVKAMTIFERKGPVWETMLEALASLERVGVPCAVIGGLACFLHRRPRTTRDVDLLIAAEDAGRAREALVEHGFRHHRTRREFVSQHGVPVHLMLSGMYPGDGRPKPVAFPRPDDQGSAETIDGLPTLTLAKLVELKLASALSNPRRARDGTDVLDLIEVHRLDKRFAAKLDKSVRTEFKRLVDAVRRYPP